MARLKAGGITTAIVTNGHAGIQRAKLRRIGVEELCDVLLVGGEEVQSGRQEKPAASIFHTACAMCGCLPDQVRPGALRCSMLGGASRTLSTGFTS